MTQPPPLPLTTGQHVLRFFIALILGSALSALVWVAGWDQIDKGMSFLILVVPGVKFVVGVALIIMKPWRSAGAGLMVSIAVGALIFFATCATHMNTH